MRRRLCRASSISWSASLNTSLRLATAESSRSLTCCRMASEWRSAFWRWFSSSSICLALASSCTLWRKRQKVSVCGGITISKIKRSGSLHWSIHPAVDGKWQSSFTLKQIKSYCLLLQHPLKFGLLPTGLHRQEVLFAVNLLQTSRLKHGLFLCLLHGQILLFPPPLSVFDLLVPPSLEPVLTNKNKKFIKFQWIM